MLEPPARCQLCSPFAFFPHGHRFSAISQSSSKRSKSKHVRTLEHPQFPSKGTHNSREHRPWWCTLQADNSDHRQQCWTLLHLPKSPHLYCPTTLPQQQVPNRRSPAANIKNNKISFSTRNGSGGKSAAGAAAVTASAMSSSNAGAAGAGAGRSRRGSSDAAGFLGRSRVKSTSAKISRKGWRHLDFARWWIQSRENWKIVKDSGVAAAAEPVLPAVAGKKAGVGGVTAKRESSKERRKTGPAAGGAAANKGTEFSTQLPTAGASLQLDGKG